MTDCLLSEKENAAALGFLRDKGVICSAANCPDAIDIAVKANGIGFSIEVSCRCCHRFEDITDYERW